MTTFDRWRHGSITAGWTLLPLRLVIGVGFLLHGLAKWNRGPAAFGRLLEYLGVPMPFAMAWIVTSLEIAGGLLLIVGFLVMIVAIPLAVSMLVAMFTIHIHYGFSSINTVGLTGAGPVFGPPGYEINLLYLAGLWALAVTAQTPWSLDRWRVGTRQSTVPVTSRN
jgi:putative oxidoreductase